MTIELPDSECFAVLADRHRRLTVRTLSELGGPLSLREVTAHIMDHAYKRVTDEKRQRVRVSLYHNHLPRLEDNEIVSFDTNAMQVSRGPNFDRLAQYLEPGTTMDRSWTTPNTSALSSRDD